MRDYLFVAAEDERLIPRLDGLAAGRGADARRGRHLACDGAEGGVFFDGIAVFGDALVRSPGELPTGAAVGRGNYVLARHRDDGSVSIEIDPIGYYPLFVHQGEGLLCVANRASRIAEVLASLGRPVERDVSVHAWFTVQGAGAAELSGYRGISLLPRGTTLHLDERNRVERRRAPIAELLYSDRPLPELLDDAAEEILANVRAVAGGPFEHRICDLTGGMDSRLVLSALIRAGVQDAFLFQTRGQHPSPDANVASLIRARFGLRALGGGGGGEAGPVRGTPVERLRALVGRADGLMSRYANPPATTRRDDARLQLGGGSGELCREFWPSAERPSSPGDGAPVPPLRPRLREARARWVFLRPAMRDAIRDHMRSFGRESLAAGVAPEHVGDHFYLASRARYHFGLWWAISPRNQFHPLYSPAAIRAGYAMSREDRTRNRIGFELMTRFSPELARLPFARKSWPRALMPDAPRAVRMTAPFLGDPDERRVRLPGAAAEAERRAPTDWERALIDRGVKSQVVELGSMLADFDASARDFGALEPVFDADAVREFLSRPHEDFRGPSGPYGAINAYRLMGAWVWANRLETAPPR